MATRQMRTHGTTRLVPGSASEAAVGAASRARRRHLLRETTLSGAFGGGLLGAGFGPAAAATGMVLGGIAGYLFERLIERRSSKVPA